MIIIVIITIIVIIIVIIKAISMLEATTIGVYDFQGYPWDHSVMFVDEFFGLCLAL